MKRPRTPWPLRLRLPRTVHIRIVSGMLTLLVLTCGGVCVATTDQLRHFLLDRLDLQLIDTGDRYASSLDRQTSGADGAASDTRAQAPGTFGACLLSGAVISAGVVDGDGGGSSAVGASGTHYGRSAAGMTADAGTDYAARLTAADQRALAGLPVGGPARSVDLSTLHGYRLRAIADRDGYVLVTGLPLRPVDETVHQLITVELLVFTLALALTGVAGALWVRWSLRPLDRVVAAAARVSALPLASGAVALSVRVPDDDPRTEVGRVGAALNRMLGHVEGALAQRQAVEERLRAFAADASHELRTPLASLRGHAELALRHPGPVSEPVRHSLARIDAESQRMGDIVGDLLLLARLDAGRPLAVDELDLTRVALDCASDARAAGPGHRWQLALPGQPVLVLGDLDRLRQVVANLLTNARIHTPEGTEVTLGLEPGFAAAPAADGVRLTVTDTGPGIALDPPEQVFERFVRGDRARSRSSGSTGLGLAIVAAVVGAHGGTVGVASRPGRTVFTVTLPGRLATPMR